MGLCQSKDTTANTAARVKLITAFAWNSDCSKSRADMKAASDEAATAAAAAVSELPSEKAALYNGLLPCLQRVRELPQEITKIESSEERQKLYSLMRIIDDATSLALTGIALPATHPVRTAIKHYCNEIHGIVNQLEQAMKA